MPHYKRWESIVVKRQDNGMFRWVVTFFRAAGGEVDETDVLGKDDFTTQQAAEDAAELYVRNQISIRHK